MSQTSSVLFLFFHTILQTYLFSVLQFYSNDSKYFLQLLLKQTWSLSLLLSPTISIFALFFSRISKSISLWLIFFFATSVILSFQQNISLYILLIDVLPCTFLYSFYYCIASTDPISFFGIFLFMSHWALFCNLNILIFDVKINTDVQLP